ncbi:MAG: hypothetical protein JXB47_04040 [Anaerolineae bacterium]|nr:hypothetical protein [Anaerolineae bacterium]
MPENYVKFMKKMSKAGVYSAQDACHIFQKNTTERLLLPMPGAPEAANASAATGGAALVFAGFGEEACRFSRL